MTLRFYHIGVVMCIPSTWTCGGMPVRAAASDDRTCASEMSVGMTTVFVGCAAFRQFLKRVFRPGTRHSNGRHRNYYGLELWPLLGLD